MPLSTSSSASAQLSLDDTDATTLIANLSAATGTAAREVKARHFGGAIVFNNSNAQRVITFTLTDGSTAYIFTKVTVAVNATATLSDADYGFDMGSTQYVTATLDGTPSSGSVIVLGRTSNSF